MIESAYRASKRVGVLEHQRALATLSRGMSETASRNPDAWDRTPLTEEQILDTSGRNRMLAFPYSVVHNSFWNVDQSAALLFCSAEVAERFHVQRNRWIVPLASTESNHISSVASRSAWIHRRGLRWMVGASAKSAR